MGELGLERATSSRRTAASQDEWEAKRRELKAAMVVQGCEDIEPLRTAIEAAKEVGMSAQDLRPALALLESLEAEQEPLTFSDLSREETEELQAMTSREEVLARLTQSLVEGGTSFQDEVMAEFHYKNFLFCQRHSFSAEKTSTLLSLMRTVHHQAVKKGPLPEAEARDIFEKLLSRHSRQLPPYSIGIFTREDVQLVRELADRGFFRHYKMLVELCVQSQREELAVRIVEKPAAPKVEVQLVAKKARGSTTAPLGTE